MVCPGMNMTPLSAPCSFTFAPCTCVVQRAALLWEGSVQGAHPESRVSTPASWRLPLTLHSVQLTPTWSVCTCSFLVSHPVLFFSSLSCLLITGDSLAISLVFLNLLESWTDLKHLFFPYFSFSQCFSCPSTPEEHANTPQFSGWLSHWFSWMGSGEGWERERETGAGKKAYRCVCSHTGWGGAYPQSSVSVLSPSFWNPLIIFSMQHLFRSLPP